VKDSSAAPRLAIEYLARTVRHHEEKTAIIDGPRTITFGALWSQAVQLAAWLGDGREGALPPVVVAIPKSIPAIVAIAAAQLAGSVYVPIDPDTPPERLARMLERLGPHLRLEAQGDAFTLEGKRFEPELGAERVTRLEAQLLERLRDRSESDPLYVMFTSGTTGIPKGVTISNASTCDYIEWLLAEHAITSRDAIGNQSPLFFDSIVVDLYATFASGATLHLIPRVHFRLPGDLLAYLADEKITFVYFVPSTFASFAAIDALKGLQLPALRKVIFSGEAMPLAVLRYLRERLPGAELCNHYGPTECTDTTISWNAGPTLASLADLSDTPIGAPRPNTRILIVDDEERVVREPGETGEILIGGSSVGLGYWNDPETTAAKFVQNPEHARYRDLYYRTGDVGQRGEGGLIYYLGRKDHQFKYLGNRIEAGEIETAILRLGPIAQCCVQYDAKRGEIVAFVHGPRDGSVLNDVRERLRASLPSYMLPRRFVTLEEFPLTTNGKIDRRAVWRAYAEAQPPAVGG
jgi:amino acid adenylation domain-containing protein